MRLGIGFSGEALSLDETVGCAVRAEAAGFESAWTIERWRSALVPAVAIGTRARALRVGTGIALAFPRSPEILAIEALDAAEVTGGRFVLGVGTGPRQTIEGLHGLAAERPAARLREYVEALRLLLAARHGERVRYGGRYFTVDGVAARGQGPRYPVPVFVAAVNATMLHVAGALGDGWIGSALTSPPYLREIVHPELDRGAAWAERRGAPATAALLTTSVASSPAVAFDRARATLAHYCRLEYYDVVLNLHGFEREAAAIREAYRAGDLGRAARAVSDRMVAELAIAGTPDECRQRLGQYRGLLDTAILYPPTGGLPAAAVRESHAAIAEAFTGWR